MLKIKHLVLAGYDVFVKKESYNKYYAMTTLFSRKELRKILLQHFRSHEVVEKDATTEDFKDCFIKYIFIESEIFSNEDYKPIPNFFTIDADLSKEEQIVKLIKTIKEYLS